jgi:hypothetical protein
MQKRIETGWEYILLPLFLINITTSANTWAILGISIGQIFFYILIAVTTAVVVLTPYRNFGLILLAFSFLFLFISLFTQSVLCDGLRVVSLGVLFMLAGARIYGDNPMLLYKQLVIFFAISIPFMICQITGLSSIFMMWNTDYLHTLDILDLSELGTFKVIPVFPTLFVGLDELNYQIGQGRPNGLFHSNNILSIFVVIGVGLNLITSKSTRLRYSDLIVMCIFTLTMSLMVFSITLLLYFYCILMGGNIYRKKAIKLIAILLVLLGLYYLFFPGLLQINFGEAKFLMSFLTRGLDLANSLGFSKFNDIFSDQLLLVGDAYKDEGTYSQFSVILKSKFMAPLIIGFLIAIFIFIRSYRFFKKKTASSTREFNIFLFCCLFSQFGVPYMVAPAYQFMLGFVFYPLLRKYWSVEYKTPIV